MLGRLWFHLRMYATFQLVHLRTTLAYEADFWIGILGVALTHGVGIVFVWTLFLSVPQVAGWSVWEARITCPARRMASPRAAARRRTASRPGRGTRTRW